MFVLFKTCSICKQEKSISDFRPHKASPDGLGCYCRDCATIYNKQRYKSKKSQIIAVVMNWQKNNRDKVRASRKRCMQSNPIARWRRNVSKTFKERYPYHTEIGGSSKTIKVYFESLMSSDMTWENYGKFWGIYRIQPINQFNLDNPEHLKQVNHYTNFKPQIFNLQFNQV